MVVLLSLLVAALLLPARAQEEEREINIRIPVGDVILAANAQLRSIEQTKFVKETNARSARVLAVLAQAIIDNDEDAPFRKTAPALRDTALELAKAETAAEAKKTLAKMKKLTAQSEAPEPNKYDLTQLADVHTLMEEVGNRHARLDKVFRKGAKDSNAAQHALVLSVLANALIKNPNGLEKQTDIDSWKEHAETLRMGSARLRVFIGEGNAAESRKSFERIGKSCAECHEKFKKE
ncbi:MAG: cytochrome c [Planctomycetaceae bacterium]|nr:cytochrome c [Planctomycetaceae bacterium]